MKKTLIALASVSAFGLAFAQQVSLYGKIDANIGVTTSNSGAAGEKDLAINQLTSGGLSGSRWGMKGTEDLGGGMSASFQLESGLAVDTGVSTGFMNQAFIKLTGNFGAISLGRQYNAADNLWSDLDAQEYSNSAMGYAWNNGAHSDAGNVNNMIQYTLPAMGNFSAYVQLAPGENNDISGRSAGNYVAVAANYANGPFAIGVAYENTSVTTAATAAGTAYAFPLETGACIATWTLANGICSKASAAAVATNVDTSNTSVGGSYDLGMMKVYAGFEQGKTTTKQDAGYSIGVQVPMGAAKLHLGYAKETQIADGNAIDGLSKAFGGQIVYAVSKRTDGYVSYVSGTANAPVAAATFQPESKLTNFSVGVRHSF
jgi:predicted porin